MTPQLQIIFEAVAKELDSAIAKHPPYNSAHEAYAVIAEEVEEFWELVRKRHHDKGAMTLELVHVAVTAIRAIEDVTLDNLGALEDRKLMLGIK